MISGAILASSWSLLAGYAGQFSFGHMAFMAIGAYGTGLVGRLVRLTTAPTGLCTEIRLGSIWLVLVNTVGESCIELGKANMPLGTLIYRPPILSGIILGVLVAGLAGLAIALCASSLYSASSSTGAGAAADPAISVASGMATVSGPAEGTSMELKGVTRL